MGGRGEHNLSPSPTYLPKPPRISREFVRIFPPPNHCFLPHPPSHFLPPALPFLKIYMSSSKQTHNTSAQPACATLLKRLNSLKTPLSPPHITQTPRPHIPSPKIFVRAPCGGLGGGRENAAECSKVSTPKPKQSTQALHGPRLPRQCQRRSRRRWRALCSFWARPCCASVGSTAGVVDTATQKRCLEPRRPKAASIIFLVAFFIFPGWRPALLVVGSCRILGEGAEFAPAMDCTLVTRSIMRGR